MKKEILTATKPPHVHPAPRPLKDAITSPNHKLVHWMAALREPDARQRRGEYLVEGMRNVHLLLEKNAVGDRQLDTLLYSPPLLIHSFAIHLVERARRLGVRCVAAEPAILQSLSAVEDGQGLIAIAKFRLVPLPPDEPSGLCWVGLERVRKPGNLGTILRTVEAAGGAGVIGVGADVDFYEPRCVRATMGALFSQTLVQARWEELLLWKARTRSFWVGTSPHGTVDFDALDYPACPVLWMGDERQGLTENAKRACDVLVRIPMTGRADSLNLAVSTGLMVYEVLRHRRLHKASLAE